MKDWRSIRTLIILGKTYEVLWCSLDEIDKKGKVWGEADWTNKRIKIYKDIPSQDDVEEVILHEIVHILKDHVYTDDIEDFVAVFTEYLYDTLKRNDLLSC